MFNPSQYDDNTIEEIEQKELTSSAYDRWSRVWSFARYTNGGIYQTALNQLDDRHQWVLDVGCGTGLMSEKLAASGRRVCGVDISQGMVERARRRVGPTVKFIQGDAESLPPEIGTFDAVINLISFHHYPNPSRALAEFRHVLRPDGRLVLVAFDRTSRYINLAQRSNFLTKSIAGKSWQKTSDEVVALVRKAGFLQVEVKPVPYWIKTFAIIAE